MFTAKGGLIALAALFLCSSVLGGERFTVTKYTVIAPLPDWDHQVLEVFKYERVGDQIVCFGVVGLGGRRGPEWYGIFIAQLEVEGNSNTTGAIDLVLGLATRQVEVSLLIDGDNVNITINRQTSYSLDTRSKRLTESGAVK